MIARPDAATYPAFYHAYVERVPDGDLVATLERQVDDTVALVSRFSPGREELRYAPGKWSVREVVGHVTDSERVFALRALWAARGDPSPQPGFDEKAWAAASNAAGRPLAELTEEFRAVRRATVLLLRGLDADAWKRRLTANGTAISLAAVAWIMAGHELHHRAVLEERYLPAAPGSA